MRMGRVSPVRSERGFAYLQYTWGTWPSVQAGRFGGTWKRRLSPIRIPIARSALSCRHPAQHWASAQASPAFGTHVPPLPWSHGTTFFTRCRSTRISARERWGKVGEILDEKGENVPAEDKVVSSFEPDSDIIKKKQREIVYGHLTFFFLWIDASA